MNNICSIAQTQTIKMIKVISGTKFIYLYLRFNLKCLMLFISLLFTQNLFAQFLVEPKSK